jgi:FkbM family methyltransferase
MNAEGWALLGAVNSKLNLYTEAVECLERALSLAPGHNIARFNLGVTLLAQSQPAAALPHFRALLARDPQMPGAIERFQQASLQAAGDETFTIRLRGSVDLIVPGSLQLMTPYVLLEQEDWFENEIAFVRKLVRAGARVLDVGANYGVYTATMARAIGPSGRLWAFEPASSTASFLRRSLAHNHFAQVELVQAALSDRRGTASLRIGPNPELNALADPAHIAGPVEQVPVRTLDECAVEFGWRDIEFVKLDAEGHEGNILRGGSEFFRRESPLVMFEFKHGDSVNTPLLEQFSSLGYALYRLVPGIGLLAPIDVRQGLDASQLNLFACKADRASVLEARGLLSRTSGANQVLPADGPLKLRAAALDTSLPPSQRLANLRQAAIDAERDAAVPSASRLQTAARIAWEFGDRAKARDWLIRLCDDPVMLASAANAAEPMLTASPHFERCPVPGAFPEWFEAAARDQLVRIHAFSSYFSGMRSLRSLELIHTLGFATAEMERRLQLIRIRFGLQTAPEPSSLLSAHAEDNLNPWFWAAGSLLQCDN